MPLARKYRLGGQPIVVWVFPDPAPFLLPSGNAIAGLTPFNEQFSAVSPNQPGMNYTLTSGTLPFGLTFSNGFGANADFAFLTGTVQTGPPPVWISPPDGSLLATLGELEDITPLNISLNAGPTPPASSIRYYVFRGALPQGIILDGNTGDFTGTAASLKGQFPPDENLNPPTWNSPADSSIIASVSESGPVSVTGWPNVTFFGIESAYYITRGRLPFGLVLARANGDITGTVVEPIGGLEPPPVDPPAFASRGYTQTVGSSPTFALSAQATPVAPKTLARYYTLTGSIPLGMTLNELTGDITGTPIAAGLYEANVVVVDSDGQANDATFNFNIS